MPEKSLVLRIQADSKNAKTGIKEVHDALDEMMRGTEGSVGKVVGGLGKTFGAVNDVLGRIALPIGLVVEAAKSAVELAEYAAKREELAAHSSRAAVASLRNATGGLVTEMSLMKAAASSMTGDFALSQRQLDMVGRAALALHGPLGTTSAILDDLTESLRTGDVGGLKKYGISLEDAKGKSEKYQLALAKLAQIASRGASAQRDLTSATDTSARAMVAVSNFWSDTKAAAGDTVNYLAEGVVAIGDWDDYLASHLANAMIWVDNFGQSTGVASDEQNRLYLAARRANVALAEQAKQAKALADEAFGRNMKAAAENVYRTFELLEYRRQRFMGTLAADAAATNSFWLGSMSNLLLADEEFFRRVDASEAKRHERDKAAAEARRERRWEDFLHQMAMAKLEVDGFATSIEKAWATASMAWMKAGAEMKERQAYMRALAYADAAAYGDAFEHAMTYEGVGLPQKGGSAPDKELTKQQKAWKDLRESAKKYDQMLKDMGTDTLVQFGDSAAEAMFLLTSGQEGAAASLGNMLRGTLEMYGKELWAMSLKFLALATFDSAIGNPEAAGEWAAFGIATAGAVAVSAAAGLVAPSSSNGAGSSAERPGSSGRPSANYDGMSSGSSGGGGNTEIHFHFGWGILAGDEKAMGREVEKVLVRSNLMGAGRSRGPVRRAG